MKLEFTDHLHQKIHERNIALSKVVETVHQPHFTRATYGNREELYKKFGKNYLMVIARQENELLVIITAHWVGKLPK